MRPSRKTRAAAPRSRRTNGKRKGGSSKAPLIIGCAAAFLAIAGLLAWLLWPKTDWFDGSKMEEFVAVQIPSEDKLPDSGVDAYIDFSNGMQHAYKDTGIKDNLMGIVNKLTKTSEFYSLANEEITPLGRQDSKEIFNRIVSEKSYDNTSAPIEKTLARILKEQRPAFLMTDFEEFTGGRIQLENYAKKYFTDWVKTGKNITFYVMDFVENGKPKHLYFTVFDDYGQRLVKQIDDALEGKHANYTRFQLANNLFPVSRSYETQISDGDAVTYKGGYFKGGNYHDANEVDAVSMIDESGTKQAYRVLEGWIAEFYPSQAESWKQILDNSAMLAEEKLDPQAVKDMKVMPFRHLLSERYFDLTCNSGYVIDEIGLKVYDVTGQYRSQFDENYTGNSSAVPVYDFLRLGKTEVDNPGEFEVLVDFDPKFNGTFSSEEGQTALYRVDIVVKKATPRYELVNQLFAWPGNNSLAESVRNTLQAVNPDDHNSTEPDGKIIYTAYFRVNGK